MKKIFNSKKSLLTRRKLRNNVTEAEALLWDQLKASQLGYKFRRQQGIDRYIVDFYCPKTHLVVEIDGGIHTEKDIRDFDKYREECFRSLELHVIRFTNDEVQHSLEEVLKRLRVVLESLSS